MDTKAMRKVAREIADKVGLRLGKGWTDTSANGDKRVAWRVWGKGAADKADTVAKLLQGRVGKGIVVKRTSPDGKGAPYAGGEYIRVRVPK